MLYYTIGQWRIFLTLLYAGFFAGAWYGLMARCAKFLGAGLVLRAFFDLLIAAGMSVIIGTGLLIANYGEPRFYALLAAAVGFALYRLTVARALYWTLKRLLHMLSVALHWFMRRTLVKKIFR